MESAIAPVGISNKVIPINMNDAVIDICVNVNPFCKK
jgi:hypothetical protein